MSADPTVLSEAERLHALGFAPIPLIRGGKRPFGQWARLQFTRLYPEYFPSLFSEQPVNLGVICGSVSRCLFSVDCDAPDAWEWLCRELAQHGITTWLRSSPRGGQALFLALDGPVQSEARDGYQIIGEGGLIVVPPSVRGDTGEIVEWLEQPAGEPLSVHLSDLPFLSLERARRRARTTERETAEKAGSLPEVADRVLLQRDTSDYDGDNSRAEYAACLSLLGAGWASADILRFFRRSLPSHFADIGEERFTQYILGAAQRNFGAGNPSHSADRPVHQGHGSLCDLLLARAKATAFSGRQAATDKAVLMALISRIRTDGRMVFRASRRELAQTANIGEKTAGRALDRLVDRGYLVRCGTDRVSGASLWEIVADKLSASPEVYTRTTADIDAVDHGDLSADIWHRSAVGKSGLHVYNHLLGCGVNGATVAAMVAVGIGAYNTVKAAAHRLRSAGLAYQEGRTWYASTRLTDTDLAIRSLTYTLPNTGKSVFGASERKRERHERERSIRASTLYLSQMRSHDDCRDDPSSHRLRL